MTWNYYSVGPETPSNLASSVCKIEAPPSPCDYRGVPNTRSITRYKHLNIFWKYFYHECVSVGTLALAIGVGERLHHWWAAYVVAAMGEMPQGATS